VFVFVFVFVFFVSLDGVDVSLRLWQVDEGVVAVTGRAGYAGWMPGDDDITRPVPGYHPTPQWITSTSTLPQPHATTLTSRALKPLSQWVRNC